MDTQNYRIKETVNWAVGGTLWTTVISNRKSGSGTQIIGCYYLDDCLP